MKQIFQEYDCLVTGIDRDLEGSAIVIQGERFHCPFCGNSHVAGVDVEMQTTVEMDDGSLDFRALPADAKERAEWLIEVGRTATFDGLGPLKNG